VNGGNQTVPTVLFPDGTALTNPSAAQVKKQLAAIVGWSAAGQDRAAGPDARAVLHKQTACPFG